MIKESLSQIEANSVLVENSKQALDGILTSIKEIASQNELIVTAITSQAEGIKQIGYSMSQLDSVSQQTITGTQEISAISNLVVDESSRLAKLSTSMLCSVGQMTGHNRPIGLCSINGQCRADHVGSAFHDPLPDPLRLWQ